MRNIQLYSSTSKNDTIENKNINYSLLSVIDDAAIYTYKSD